MAAGETASAPRFELGHRPELDGIRAIAVALVMGFHLTLATGGRFYGPPSGLLGVDVFFVLSGFLITALLVSEHDRNGRISLGGFWWRRAIRILPALYAFLCGAVIVSIVLGASIRSTVLAVGSALTNTMNWLVVARGQGNAGLFLPLWSLSIEEQFYLLWPIVLALAWRRFRLEIGLVLAGAGAWLAIGVWRAYLVSTGHLDTVYFRTDTRVDAVIAGAVLAFALHRWGTPRGNWRRLVLLGGWAGLVTIGLVATLLTDQRQVAVMGFPLAATSTIAVILASFDPAWSPARVLRSRPLTWIGRRSYPLYLWHLVAFKLTELTLHGAPWFVFLAVAISSSLAIAAASNRWIEGPFRALRAAPAAQEAEPRLRTTGVARPLVPRVLPPRPAIRRALAASGVGTAGLLVVLVGPAFAARSGRVDLTEQAATSPSPQTTPSEGIRRSTTHSPLTSPQTADPGGHTLGSTVEPSGGGGTVGSGALASVLDLVEAVITNGEPRMMAVKVQLTLFKGDPLPNRSVRIEVGGYECSATTDARGVGTCSVPANSLGPNSDDVIFVSFAGDAQARASEATRALASLGFTTGQR